MWNGLITQDIVQLWLFCGDKCWAFIFHNSKEFLDWMSNDLIDQGRTSASELVDYLYRCTDDFVLWNGLSNCSLGPCLLKHINLGEECNIFFKSTFLLTFCLFLWYFTLFLYWVLYISRLIVVWLWLAGHASLTQCTVLALVLYPLQQKAVTQTPASILMLWPSNTSSMMIQVSKMLYYMCISHFLFQSCSSTVGIKICLFSFMNHKNT